MHPACQSDFLLGGAQGRGEVVHEGLWPEQLLKGWSPETRLHFLPPTPTLPEGPLNRQITFWTWLRCYFLSLLGSRTCHRLSTLGVAGHRPGRNVTGSKCR